MYVYYYETTLGKMGIVTENDQVIQVFFGKKRVIAEEKETELIREVHNQIHEYLMGDRKQFDIPIKITGTPFQKKVYKALLKIPYGQTSTYEQIAKMLNNPKAYRAVGLSNGKNPIAIIIPCHRVIGKNGNLTGYAGGLTRKKKLLNLEHKNNEIL